jgi:PKD repeat protein
MKKITLFMALLALSLPSIAQIPDKPLAPSLAHKIISQKNQTLLRAPVSCGIDTLYYPTFKTTTPESKILFSNGTYVSEASQWFPASASVPLQLKGFKWYGYSVDPSGLTNPSIAVQCAVYLAGTDSLPTGSALATTTITVDTVTANAERIVLFSNPVVISSHYVLVISNPSADYLFYAGNDEDAADGNGERLSGSYYEPGGFWRKNEDLWANGDYDNLFIPIVGYSIEARFTGNSSACVGVSETFTNTSTGYFGNRFFNAAVAAGNPVSYYWNYGDGATDAYQQHGNHSYAAVGSYSVVLRDTLYGWTMTCTSSKSLTVDVFSIPAAPSATPPAPVCEGTAIGALTATGTGGTMKWYSNAAPSGFLGSGNPYNSTISANTTVYVTETLNGCESAPTAVVLTFLPNAVPGLTSTPTGGTTIDFSTATVATSYSWDPGDGSPLISGNSFTHTYPGAGPYTACLTVTYSNGCSRQKCKTISFLDVSENVLQQARIFPNPAKDIVTITIPNTSQDVGVVLLDATGRVIKTLQTKGTSVCLMVGELAYGIYFLRLSSDEIDHTVRLLIE